VKPVSKKEIPVYMRRVLFCLMLLSVCLPAPAQERRNVEEANAKSLALVGKPAPEIQLKDLDEYSVDLSNRRGQVVVLAFWATWCPPCRAELPMLERLQKELAPQGVSIIPIAVDSLANARSLAQKKAPTMMSLVDSRTTIATKYGAHALPKTFLIDRNGVVRQVIFEKLSEAKLRSAIDSLR
jgi:peroxiredoxin